jgi:hypothetical protein
MEQASRKIISFKPSEGSYISHEGFSFSVSWSQL